MAPGGTTQQRPKRLQPGHQALPDSGSGLGGRGGVKGAASQLAFQFLPNTPSISCPGCKFQPFPSWATSGLCPLPGPALTLAGTGQSLSCQLRVWNQLGPQPSILPRGPGRLEGAEPAWWGAGLHVTLRIAAPTVCPSRAGTGDPETGGGGQRRDVGTSLVLRGGSRPSPRTHRLSLHAGRVG